MFFCLINIFYALVSGILSVIKKFSSYYSLHCFSTAFSPIKKGPDPALFYYSLKSYPKISSLHSVA